MVDFAAMNYFDDTAAILERGRYKMIFYSNGVD